MKLNDFNPPLTADERTWLTDRLAELSAATTINFKKLKMWMVPWAPTERMAETNIVDVYRSENEASDA